MSNKICECSFPTVELLVKLLNDMNYYLFFRLYGQHKSSCSYPQPCEAGRQRKETIHMQGQYTVIIIHSHNAFLAIRGGGLHFGCFEYL